MRRPGRLRTIPAMIRDKSTRKPAKDAPEKGASKKDAAKKAAPVKAAKGAAVKAPAGRQGAIIAVASPSFRRSRPAILALP